MTLIWLIAHMFMNSRFHIKLGVQLDQLSQIGYVYIYTTQYRSHLNSISATFVFVQFHVLGRLLDSIYLFNPMVSLTKVVPSHI